VPAVPRDCSLNHDRRTVDRRDRAIAEPIADQRDRNAAAAADLEEVVVGLDREPLDGPVQARRHGVGHGRRS
jgi:hypothetical protein